MTSITSTSSASPFFVDPVVSSSASGWVSVSVHGTLLRLFHPYVVGAAISVAVLWSLPTVSASPTIADQRHPPIHAPPTLSSSVATVRSTAERLQTIGHVLSLSKSELAKVMRVARPSLYDWLNGKSEPRDENAQRLSIITGIVEKVTHGDSRHVFPLFVTEPIHHGEPSILECFQREVLDRALIEKLLAMALDLTAQRDQRLAKFERESRAVRQSPAHREALLDLNLTLAEWDQV